MGMLRQKAATARRRLPLAWNEFFNPPVRYPAPELGRSLPMLEMASERARATHAIHARLEPDHLGLIAERVEAGEQAAVKGPGTSEDRAQIARAWRGAQGLDRKRCDLMAGTFYAIPEVLEATGLQTAAPPHQIHAMSHSAAAAGGGFYEADMIADALGSAGLEIGGGQRLLDFGCSSGRVVRVLQAAFPEAQFFGCDPNGPAIEWAQQNLVGAEFFRSGNEPPLEIETASLSAVFAVSIWSHYAERLALLWYDEMMRILKPGGLLVATTHGAHAVAHYHGNGLRNDTQLSEIQSELWDSGYWYIPEFGAKGDWGVVNSEWGTAFVTPEWMLGKLTPQWEFVEYANGRNHDNQDLYVLRKPL